MVFKDLSPEELPKRLSTPGASPLCSCSCSFSQQQQVLGLPWRSSGMLLCTPFSFCCLFTSAPTKKPMNI